ncbi:MULTISPECIES: DUF262 domain-containing protein [unclassified Exiguobacterium]|uniref:DUF262 domain-containing protein n=1 Tax=unclassified Exiguobacterium TaxID=2644629 RepID=UPI001BE94978|nr:MULTISPECIES: DUF262 domain-containing protein [unclassified Exiguobacterium]
MNNVYDDFNYEVNTNNNSLNFKYKNQRISLNISDPILFYEEVERIIEEEDFKDYLKEFYMKLSEKNFEASLDGVEGNDDEEDKYKKEPYDPTKVRYTLKIFSAASLVSYVTGFEGEEEPTINLHPDFQRNFVWSAKDKSLLIESMLLNIPIPAIYLNETEMGKYFPADGLQRLNTLTEFMTGKLKLTGLEYLEEYNGFKYKKINDNDKVLPINIKRQIRDYQITCYVIEYSTPEKIKLDIFKRLNSSGVKLTSQELRNAITSPQVRILYNKIEENSIFKRLIKDTVNTNRFVHHEFILRFFGFYYSEISKEISYKGTVKNLLDSALIKMNSESNEKLKDVADEYISVLEKSYYLFGENSFRRSNASKKHSKFKTPINTVLYVQILLHLIHAKLPVGKEIGFASEEFFKYLENNQDFLMSISSATSNQKNIVSAREHVNRFFDFLFLGEERN